MWSSAQLLKFATLSGFDVSLNMLCLLESDAFEKGPVFGPGKLIPVYTALQTRRQPSSVTVSLITCFNV
jgi:hypothetical protein